MEEIKNELLMYLPRLISGISSLSKNFHMEQLDKAKAMLADAIEGIEWVCRAFSALLPHKANYINAVNAQLLEINDSLENRNYVMVADLFEYEIIPVLQRMKEEIMNDTIN